MNSDSISTFKETEDRINSSANDIRILLIFLLIAEVFIIITISSISDLQLLMRKDLYAIPFLGFDVDVVNFFIFSPLFVLFLTYNVNSSLFIHCKQLKNIDNKVNNENIASNFINRIYINERPLEKILIHINISVLISFIPIFIQFYLLARFLDYQSMLITLFHLSMVFSTFFISIYYWQRISNPELLTKDYDNIKKLKSTLRRKVYYRLPSVNNNTKEPKLIYFSLAKSSLAIIFFYLLIVCLHPYIYQWLGIVEQSIDLKFLEDKNLKNISQEIIKDYEDFTINILTLVTISLICRKVTSLVISIIVLFLLIEAPFFLYKLGALNNINFIYSYLDHIEVVYFLFISLLITLKLQPIRKAIHRIFPENIATINKLFKPDEFKGIYIWQFVEISIPTIILTTSIILTLFLLSLLIKGKFDSESLSYINKAYPNIDVSEKQIFDLSKSSQLFEISHSNNTEYLQNMQTLKKCVSLSGEICHFIEPITINNRSLLFSKFENSRMYQVRITNSNLSYSNFTHSHMEGSTIKFSDIINADFSFAKLQGSDLLHVVFNNSKMKYTNISDSTITNSKLEDLDMCHISFNNSKMYRSNFSCSLKMLENNDKNCRCDVSVYDFSPAIFQQNKIANIIIDFKDYIYSTDNRNHPVMFLDKNKLLDNNNKNFKLQFNTQARNIKSGESIHTSIFEIYEYDDDKIDSNNDNLIYISEKSNTKNTQDKTSKSEETTLKSTKEHPEHWTTNNNPKTHPHIINLINMYEFKQHDEQKNELEHIDYIGSINMLYCNYYRNKTNNGEYKNGEIYLHEVKDEYIKIIADDKFLEPKIRKSIINILLSSTHEPCKI